MSKRDNLVPGVQKDPPEYGETHPPRNDLKEQRGGPQDNQITGETERGARNQVMKGQPPPEQGDKRAPSGGGEKGIRDNGP